MLETARDAVKALGGPTAVGGWLRLDQSTISAWSVRGEIGRGWALHIYWSLRDRGYRQQDISPRIFGIERWDQVVMPRPKNSKRLAKVA
jgi:hypothetical protein